MNQPKTSTDLINESVEFVKKLKQSAHQSAMSSFANLVKEELTKDINESMEPFSTEPDQPSNYDMEGGQKRIDGPGDAIEDKGEGEDIIEGDTPDESGATMSKVDGKVTAKNAHDTIAEMDDLDLDLKGDDDEEDMNMDMKVETEDEDKKKKEKVDETEDAEKEKMVKENNSLKKMIATLKTENAKLKKGLSVITKHLDETALINSKMTYVNKINSDFPNLSVSTKKKVYENIQKSKNMNEAKMVFETMVAVLKEKYKASANTNVTTRSKQIVEAARKNNENLMNEGINSQFNRMEKLAGLE